MGRRVRPESRPREDESPIATQTTIEQRIEISLEAVRGHLGDLPEIAAGWEQLADGERVSCSPDWAHLMADSLSELDEHCRAGNMTPEQQERHRNLLHSLKTTLTGYLKQLSRNDGSVATPSRCVR